MKIKLSKTDWETIGVKMGWMKEAYTKRLDQPLQTSTDEGYVPTGFDAAFFGGLPKGARNEIMELSKMIGGFKTKMKNFHPDSVEYKKLQEKIDRINKMIAEIKAKYPAPESEASRAERAAEGRAEGYAGEIAAMNNEGVIPSWMEENR